MIIVCLNMGGVLVPGISIAFGKTCVPECGRTRYDEGEGFLGC
jgi:hypothetical protein